MLLMIADKRQFPVGSGNAAFAERLELFFGAATDTLCRVYARLEDREPDADARLSGTISGPECEYAHTLPATFALADRGPGVSLLAEAVIPDPCFWTPDLPHLYRVRVELRRGGKGVAAVERPFGIRPLGVRGKCLAYHNKRWVLRGVNRQSAPRAELADWREAGAAMVLPHPDETLCERASRTGILLVAELSGDRDHILGELRRLGRWPAVGAAVLDGNWTDLDDIGRVAPNLLLAERFSGSAEVRPAPWAHLAVVEVEAGQNAAEHLRRRVGGLTLPAIVLRPAGVSESIGDARTLCDHLQRDLAALGDFAGYIV
jgi:hypothetical protein